LARKKVLILVCDELSVLVEYLEWPVGELSRVPLGPNGEPTIFVSRDEDPS